MPREYYICVATAGDKAIAGPLTAAALVVSPDAPAPRFTWTNSVGRREQGVDNLDSVPSEVHEKVCRWFRRSAVSYGVAVGAPEQINTQNIRCVRQEILGRAIYRAVERAAVLLPDFHLTPDTTTVIVTGKDHVPAEFVGKVRQQLHTSRTTKPGFLHGAHALAKDYRAGLMLAADRKYPEYQFAVNKGYASDHHKRALRVHGLSPYHLLSCTYIASLELK